MSEAELDEQLARAERALARIEAASAGLLARPSASAAPAVSGRDDALRAAVREVVGELDRLIAAAGHA